MYCYSINVQGKTYALIGFSDTSTGFFIAEIDYLNSKLNTMDFIGGNLGFFKIMNSILEGKFKGYLMGWTETSFSDG